MKRNVCLITELFVSLQVTFLEDLNKPGRKVCVANTHLYWHPKGKMSCLLPGTPELLILTSRDCQYRLLRIEFISFEGGNVRLVQMGVALKHLSHVISEVAPGAPLVFCGDFNSTPNAGNSRIVPTAESETVYKNIMTLRSKFIFTMFGVFFNTVFIRLVCFLISSPLRCVSAAQWGCGSSAACRLEQLGAGGVLQHGAALWHPPSAECLRIAGLHQLCERVSRLPGLHLYTARLHAGTDGRGYRRDTFLF